ncbi:salivary peroxidase/catechol oxidase-like [Styela clava]
MNILHRNCLLLVFLLQCAIKCSTFGGMNKGNKNRHKEQLAYMKCPHLRKKIERECPYSTRYLKADGSCNNHVNADAGSTFVPLRRLLPAQYGDGIQSVKLAQDGEALPNARWISNVVKESGVSEVNSNVFSHMFVQMGQYLAHDAVLTPQEKEEDKSDITCDCDSTRPECHKIPVPEDDIFYSGKRSCIPLVRSAAVPGTSCKDKPREQFNSITAYWDGNTVYGSDETLMSALRDSTSESGELNVRIEDGDMRTPKTDSLPFISQVDPDKKFTFACPEHLHKNKETCFAGGEARINENQGLISMHTLFAREHNRIARKLKSINPSWTSNETFWETRRIIAAISQHITYSEFVPALVGEQSSRRYDLEALKYGNYYGYDATYDASISNVWATAAFRYGHSMVKEMTSHLNSEYKDEIAAAPMHEMLFNPSPLHNMSAHRDALIIRGLLEDSAENADIFMNEELRSKMFLSETKIGVDLFAINVERGRLHGLPGYNDWRSFCGLNRFISFDDFSSDIPREKMEILSKLYKNVNDIDLFVGGLAETPLENAAVGPTFSCLNAEQFRAMKKGDKSWYENPGSFSYEQLQEIRKVSLSTLICQNVFGMKTIQPRAMYLPSVSGNERISCNDIPEIDFHAWRMIEKPEATGILTRWFPKSVDETGQQVLQRELTRHGDQICTGATDYKKQSFKNHGKVQERIRFSCPHGSIVASDFPNSVKDHSWTQWFDRDSPSAANGDDVESLGRLLLELPQEICRQPISMQARTVSMTMGLETEETLEYFGPQHGLVCKARHQPNNKGCSDYSIRFLCPNEFFEAKQEYIRRLIATPGVIWTDWINFDDEDGKGDFESPALSRFLGKHVCRRPLLIDGRIAGTNISVRDTNDVMKRLSPIFGLQCLNADQERGKCHNYEVRYLCHKK